MTNRITFSRSCTLAALLALAAPVMAVYCATVPHLVSRPSFASGSQARLREGAPQSQRGPTGSRRVARRTLRREAQRVAVLTCTPPATRYQRTILYFGLARPAGTVSEEEWQVFVRDEVTPRFPDGLTIWEVNGQWRQASGRIITERSKVLLLVHADTPAVHSRVAELIARYKQLFEQESVLWETAPVCVVF